MKAPTRIPTRVLVAVWVGGMAVAAAGTYLFSTAVDSYVAEHSPLYRIDFYAVPAPSAAESVQAWLATILLVVGLAAAWASLFLRVKGTVGGWLLLRSLAALLPIALTVIGLRGFFQVLVYTFCGDCGPPGPDNPALDLFSWGGSVLIAVLPASVVVALVLLVFAIRRFVTSKRRA